MDIPEPDATWQCIELNISRDRSVLLKNVEFVDHHRKRANVLHGPGPVVLHSDHMLHRSVKEKQCHKDGLDGGVKNCHLHHNNKEQENNRDRLTHSLGKCIRSPLPKHVNGECVNALHHTYFKVLDMVGGGKVM